ncbi:MAG: hypothetical protein LBQ62_08015 [Candidatus Accumulibacter sp.]|jgi:hypothetical protein|nr:hypothetical protein [Accumulibacter sp.]
MPRATPATPRHREEVVNTCLAILMARHGLDAEAEALLRSGEARPDVLFTLGGLRAVIEGKYADVPNADDVVSNDAARRVTTGICHIAVAVVYPEALRAIALSRLDATLAAARLRYRIFSEAGQTDWAEATPSELLAALRRVHGVLVQDDVVAIAAENLVGKIECIAALWPPTVCDKLSLLLEMPIRKGEAPEEREARRITATKVASLVLANALIFQEQLAAYGDDARVPSLRTYDEAPDPIAEIKAQWNWIHTKINFVPIFQLAESILTELAVTPPVINAFRGLIQEAQAICANQSALRHDLMGRIYHWMLYHAKYLGTYYTSTAAATLLLKLTFAQNWGKMDFGSARQLTDFTVSDLTCGTGTLLMAAAQAITDKYVLTRVQGKKRLEEADLKTLHRTLMENILYGYDVLPSAVHLTAATLGMLAPDVTFRRMNLFIMPLGMQGRIAHLGSLDFIDRSRVETQLALDDSQLETRKTSVSGEHIAVAEAPQLDLCVMNPPFVRSVGGNLLFGSLPENERAKLQADLKKRARDLPASITAGLGSVFMAIADKYLRTGGRMAFILPAALATGEAWGISRKMIAEGYHLETVIVSHDAERPNFSENTDLSELMFIARKREKNEAAGNTTYINLWYNPRAIYEAIDVSDRIGAREGATILNDSGRKLAEIIELPPRTGEAQWIGVQFAQAPTLKAAAALDAGKLAIPGSPPVDLPLCALGSMGAIGPDRKRIHEGFKVSRTDWSPYPAFWNHSAKAVTCIRQEPNSWLLPWQESPRGADYGERRLWPRSGRILLIERLWPITHRVLATGFDRAVLGNTWWAFQSSLSPEQEKALLLWLNSTPALLMTLSRRVTTEGAWMQMKKPQWAAMPVLAVTTLSTQTLARLAAAFDDIGERVLLALAKLDDDPTRAAIDNALSVILQLPDFALLRQLLAREPGLTGKSLSPKPEGDHPQKEIATQLRLWL